eukprot:scaffold31249_cov53-Attheya_sp.AAC.3
MLELDTEAASTTSNTAPRRKGNTGKALVASFLFLIGASLLVASFIVADGTGGRILIVVATLVFLTHAGLELFTDISGARSGPHSRYADPDKKVVNLLQSIVFSAAALLQGGAFLMEQWDTDAVRNHYVVVNLVAGHVWLASGILTCYSCGCRGSCCFSMSVGANAIYVTSTMILFLAAYEIRTYPNDFLGTTMQHVVSYMWVIVGCLNLMDDYMRHARTISQPDRNVKLLLEE